MAQVSCLLYQLIIISKPMPADGHRACKQAKSVCVFYLFLWEAAKRFGYGHSFFLTFVWLKLQLLVNCFIDFLFTNTYSHPLTSLLTYLLTYLQLHWQPTLYLTARCEL